MITRHIQPALVDYFNAQLKDSEAFKVALSYKVARNIFILAAGALVGIREQGGNNRGRIVEMLQSTLGPAEGEPWCMGLIQSCLAFAEQTTGRTSPLESSEHCLTVWNESPAIQRVRSQPAPGAIVIWRHGSTSNGHTGVVVRVLDAETFECIEGNTESGNASGKVERDGGGVYVTHRKFSGNGEMRVVGFLKPF